MSNDYLVRITARSRAPQPRLGADQEREGGRLTDTIHKFKLWDKVRALELLAKHFAPAAPGLPV